jgi:hypothetical protein
LILLALVLALTVTVPSASTARADSLMPAGTCPTGFTRMAVMEHDNMEHTHVGLKVDLNENGYLCMSTATSAIHVHMDDVLPGQ